VKRLFGGEAYCLTGFGIKRPKIITQQKIITREPAQAYAYIRKKIQTEYAAAGLSDGLRP
jgi:hypothetical protein